jgi:hypothetical protein
MKKAKRRKSMRKKVVSHTEKVGDASNPIEGVVNAGKDRSIAALIALAARIPL